MPHFNTSPRVGVIAMEVPKMTYYEPALEITSLRPWVPGQPATHQHTHNPKDPLPIEIDGFLIPNDFGMRIYFESLSTKGLEWCVILRITIGAEGIPKTKSIEVMGDGLVKQDQTDEVIYTNVNRIERIHLEIVTQELRRLEALSIKLAAETWGYNRQLASWHHNISPDEPLGKLERQKKLKSLEKEIMNRVSYRKIDDIFLRRISKLFKEGKKMGQSPYDHIMDVIGREESRDVKLKTVQRWITDARKNGYLLESKEKKVSAPKAGSKSKSKTKRGSNGNTD